MLYRAALIVGCLSLMASILQGQEQRQRIQVTISTGVFYPTGEIGSSSPDGTSASTELLLLRPSPGIGLDVDFPIHGALALRGGARYGFWSQLQSAQSTGRLDSCGSRCQYLAYDTTALTSAAAGLVSVDILLRPEARYSFPTPYLVAGLG